MNFATFIDFLNCLYINEVEDATRTNNQERIATMVFEGSFEGDASADPRDLHPLPPVRAHLHPESDGGDSPQE